MSWLSDYEKELDSQGYSSDDVEPVANKRPVPKNKIEAGVQWGAEQITGAVETTKSLVSGMALWPISKSAGVSALARGGTAEQARQAQDWWASLASQPKSEVGKETTELVGKAFDVALWPAKKFGEGVTDIVGPRAGYLAELGAELATFKIGGKVSGKLKARTKAKQSPLTKTEQRYVDAHIRQKEIKNLQETALDVHKMPVEKAWETVVDKWIGKEDVHTLEGNVEARLLQKELVQKSDGNIKLARNFDEAIQIHIDTKRNPRHIEEHWDKLSDSQKDTVRLSQNLPKEIKQVAEQIELQYDKIGAEALGADVIKNTIDNYASRAWKDKQKIPETGQKFSTKTRHSKQRKYETIIEGWANGEQLAIKGATTNLKTLKGEIHKVIGNKQFIKEVKKLKTKEGEPLLTSKSMAKDEYVRIDNSQFKNYEWAGKVKDTEGKMFGKDFFKTEDGNIFENRELYAHQSIAKDLNNMVGSSQLYKIPGVKGLSKFNAQVKSWVLQSSLFHHMAFMRSYYFGVNGKRLQEMGIRDAYKGGINAIELKKPELMHGVRNGLTLGLKQDWQENLLREGNFISRSMDKHKAPKAVKDIVVKLREMQADFLFGEFGAGLKANAFLIEYRNQVKKHPNTSPNIIAKRVAKLINEDFGGLHLKRMGRNPTVQHLLQLALLAPDWTESNLRTVTGMIKSKKSNFSSPTKGEAAMYRKFWGGVVVKGMGASALANFAFSGGDVDELMDNYKEAWKSGNMNWAKVDITPIYDAFGGGKAKRKYFSLIGHFLDPAKWIAHPPESIHHKGSIVSRQFFEARSGADWRGHQFTTIGDLLDLGKTTKWGPGRPINWDTFPSYVLSQTVGTQPIQLQNFIYWMNGEVEGFDAVARSIGMGITSSRGR